MDQGTDPVTGRPAAPPIDTTRTSRDPEAIADDIRETRAEMDETIDALSAKLSPSHLIDEAKDAFTSSARDAGSSMLESFKDSSFLDTIKENPVPAAAVGLSVAWFLSKMGEAETDRYRDERFRATGDPYYAPRPRARYGAYRYGGSRRYAMYDDDRSYGDSFDARRFGGSSDDESFADKASDALDTAKDKAGNLVDSARDAVSGSADATRDRAHRAGQQVGRYERQAASWLDRQMTANPLAVGAVALAAGALVGLSVPETDAERRAFGDQADDVKRQLADVASDEIDKVKGAAQDVAQQAKDKASSLADEAADKGKSVADSATSRAKDVAGEAEDKAKTVADKASSGSTASASSTSGTSSSGSTSGGSTPRSTS